MGMLDVSTSFLPPKNDADMLGQCAYMQSGHKNADVDSAPITTVVMSTTVVLAIVTTSAIIITFFYQTCGDGILKMRYTNQTFY